MAWFTGQLLVLLVVAFLLGLLLGYVLWIWGWRRHVERTVDVDVETRQVGVRELPDERTVRLEEEVRRLRTAVDEREASVAALGARVEERDAEVAALRSRVDQRNGELALLRSRVADRDATIVALRQRDEDHGPDRVVRVPEVEGADGPDPWTSSPRAAAAAEELDDLTRVEGIGPKMQAALRAAGIRTFRALAATDVPDLRSAIEAAGMRFAPSMPTWPRQASLLAAGDEEGLASLHGQLVAGRDEGLR